MKRPGKKVWLCMAGVAVIAVAAYAMPALLPANQNDRGACGLGLPPGAPGFARQEEQREAEVGKRGYQTVCAANLERYAVTFLPMALATARLPFQPVDLTHTPFAQLTALGGQPESVGDTQSRLYRGFRTPDGHTLTLFEHNMSADGSNMWRDPKDEQERVNGLPARLVVQQTGSGRAVSVLSLRQGRRYLELWLDANAARDPLRARLFALAAALPAAIPACPNEAPPNRVALGPDGLPDLEPPPKTLAPDQMGPGGARRACK